MADDQRIDDATTTAGLPEEGRDSPSPETEPQSEAASQPETASTDANEGPSAVSASEPDITDIVPQAEPFALESPKAAPVPEPKKQPAKKQEEASQSPFSVTVGLVYDGPLDLLLDLIRKQNIDIYDIPIGRITAQFLEYTHHLKQVDVDAAGEFVYVASLLIHIKSKTLLPRDPTELGGLGDAEDPRRELVERLLEHERFKAAAQMLLQKQQIEEATWSQSGMKAFLREEGMESLDGEREIAADTVDLVRVFQDVLARLRERPVHNIDEDAVTVAQMIDFVKRRLLMEDRPISLRKMLSNTRSERALICTFLAMLELVRLQAILLRQVEEQGDIMIKKTTNFDQVIADQAQIRDDWG
ncbi:MAG TPA: segregation/condensation protein A [Acidobacteriaceae bacterium]|jgi:segregation and condensation protein A